MYGCVAPLCVDRADLKLVYRHIYASTLVGAVAVVVW